MKLKSLMRFICAVIAFAVMCMSTASASADSSGDALTSTALVFGNSDDSVESQATSNKVYGPGTHYMGSFTFYDYNNGYYHTYSGKRMRMRIAYRQEDDDYYSADLLIRCYGYSDGHKFSRPLCAGQVEPLSNGYRYYTLDWIPILSGGDYRFEYEAYTCQGGDIRRTVNCHVWIDVE